MTQKRAFFSVAWNGKNTFLVRTRSFLSTTDTLDILGLVYLISAGKNAT